MSVKIRISYTTEEELAGVLRLLSPVLKDCRISNNRDGRYKKAYAEIRAVNSGKQRRSGGNLIPNAERTKSEARRNVERA